MAHGEITDEDLAELIRRTGEAASALMRGDVRGYLSFIRHADDYTLMAPRGGEPVRGFDGSDESVASMEQFFGGDGEAVLEIVQSYASGDMAVLAAIERQHGEIGGLDQDWSLRVTLVFRRDGSDWRLVHRHADPLVHGISGELMAAIARGDPNTS